MNYKILALIIIAVSCAYRLALSVVRRKSFANPVPENVSDVYDSETYAKWKRYSAEKASLEVYSILASSLLTFVLILTNAFSWVSGMLGNGVYAVALAVTLFSALTEALIGIPFQYVDDMIIEQKYGFNRTTKQTFVSDRIKETVISLILACGLTCLLTLVHSWLGSRMIIVFAAILFALILLISFVFPFLTKIFNKFTDLEEGELKEKLTAMLEGHGYHVRSIQVMDASKRSSKTNAYFAGFGKTKTIVLYDTLVKAMTPDEICAVFAHEMGHGLHRDTLKNQLSSLISVFLIACAAYAAVSLPEIYPSFGFEGVNYGFAMILTGIALDIVNPLFSILTNARSRRAEYRADAQAAAEGYAGQLVSALKKLARANFSHLSPAPVIVMLEYSHPTLSQRINAIERCGKR